MTAFRKAIIVFYILLVTVLVTVPLLDGLGVINLKDGTGLLIAQIAVATAVPVAIAAMKTTDFFREDPHDVARLKHDQAAAISKLKTDHLDAMAKKDAVIAQMNTDHFKSIQAMQSRPVAQVIPIMAPGGARTQEKKL